jgi:CPA2 family monovalent cation:H+ antiporter-2
MEAAGPQIAEAVWIKDLLIVLAAAGIIVPLFRRLGVSVVLGFLIAGVILGPHGLARLADQFPPIRYGVFLDESRVAPFAELGVLFLMFTIGLELSAERLIGMRRLVFGLGTLQVVATAAIIAAVALLFGNGIAGSAVIGVALSFASTAIVLQVLIERRQLGTPLGQAALGILLLQDLAVVPVLVGINLLGGEEPSIGAAVRGIGIAAATIAIIIFAGRFLAKPLLRIAARSGSRELILAIALFVAIGAGLATAAAGLSPVLGAFLAGLLLGSSEYRHQVDLDIEPFKGLLLGLFFMTVGMSLDLAAVSRLLPWLLLSVIALASIKGAIVFAAGRIAGESRLTALGAAFVLAGCGEFAFVVFRTAGGANLIPPETIQFMMAVAALTMIATPLLASLGRTVTERAERRMHERIHGVGDGIDGLSGHLVIAGFGRVGEMVARILDENSVSYVALDLDGEIVAHAREVGRPVHFGDAGRREMLERVGGAHALGFVVTLNDSDKAQAIVDIIRQTWPNAPIYARAHDSAHAQKLIALGATVVVPETVEGSLQLAGSVLEGIGLPEDAVFASVEKARDKEDTILRAGDHGAGTAPRY